jgi:signal transduction histidine kinase
MDADLLKLIDRNTINELNDEKILIFDSTFRLIYSSINDQAIKYAPDLLRKIERNKIIRYTAGDQEIVGLSLVENGSKGIILASAHDQLGKTKLKKLYYILVFSFLAALIVTAVISYFYVKKVFSPLDSLNRQIMRIGDGRLNERVPIKDNEYELNVLARNFNDMLDKLEDAFRLQKNFIQHASHELRTPLANLVASCESALNKNLSKEEYRELILSLSEEHKNLVTLTNALLLLSKYENATDYRDLPETRLDEALFAAIEETQEFFPEHHIRFDFTSLPENEHALKVKGHDVLLRTLFGNLLRNACQYAEDKQVNLSLQFKDKEILVKIENTGEMIADSEIPLLFNPFFRGENAMNKKGYGLGLAIAQRIVQLHLGYLFYSKDHEKRTNTFVIVLPQYAV